MTRLDSLRLAARAAVVAAAIAAAGSGPALAATLSVRRAPDESSGASSRSGAASVSPVRRAPAARPPATALEAEVRRQIEERHTAWRSFPDVMTTPKVDWSPLTSRAKPWRPLAHRSDRKRSLSAAGEALAAPLDTARVIRVAFLRIDFANDRGGDASTGNGKFDLSRPGADAIPVDRPPHNRSFYLDHFEALSRYYYAQSYQRSRIQGDVWPRTQDQAYTCNDMADFGPWKFSRGNDVYRAAVKMFQDMMVAADTQSVKRFGDRIPWGSYDAIVVIHAGSDLQSDVRQDSPEDIPSFTVGVVDSDAVVVVNPADGTRDTISRASIIPETANQDGYYGAINGVIAHECGHLLFGFEDLYNTVTGFPTVGLWSLMDSGNLVGSLVQLPDKSEIFATGLLPPSIDPWQRSFTTDQLVFEEASYGDTMPLRNIERYPDLRAVSLSSDEYLLLENRWIATNDTLELDQGDSTRVVLGPKNPDRYEYDALLPARTLDDGTVLPACGILVWHIDQSVIPNEFSFPCDTARANYDCGFNSDPRRLAISVVEADGLADLGDPNSPYILGSPRDPYFLSNNSLLADSTQPNLRPNIGTLPHIRLTFLDEPDSTMRFAAFRAWQLPGWPIAVPLPPEGPQLLAIDLDGDRLPEVCWAGGPIDSPDSTGIFGVRGNGAGAVVDSTALIARLDRRPLGVMAAIERGEVGLGPSVLAVTTRADGPDLNTPGGRVWLIDHLGQTVGGWPPVLPAIVTTPPVIAWAFQDTFVYVGCADGRIYALGLDGSIKASSDPPLPGGVTGRLAVYTGNTQGNPAFAIAAGGADGSVAVFDHVMGISIAARNGGAARAAPTTLTPRTGWPVQVGANGFAPDFLWIDFSGSGSTELIRSAGSRSCFDGSLALVVHQSTKLWAYCTNGDAVPGWGRDLRDTIVAGLAAGDPDGDGFPEVVTLSTSSQVSYFDVDGFPAPGWPKHGTTEHFRTDAGPLTVDLARTGRTQTIAMNASGIVDAFDVTGHEANGWPLATGLEATGSPVLADLNGDHFLELVAPDSSFHLYAYSLPTRDSALVAPSWPMLGGDPLRSSALPAARTPAAVAAAPGPYVKGSLKAYPNPARRKPVTFAYRLTEPGSVEFRILDTSGHEVANFTRPARQSDNVEVWEPGALPAGLYMARLRFVGAGTEHVEIVPVGLLR